MKDAYSIITMYAKYLFIFFSKNKKYFIGNAMEGAIMMPFLPCFSNSWSRLLDVPLFVYNLTIKHMHVCLDTVQIPTEFDYSFI